METGIWKPEGEKIIGSRRLAIGKCYYSDPSLSELGIEPPQLITLFLLYNLSSKNYPTDQTLLPYCL